MKRAITALLFAVSLINLNAAEREIFVAPNGLVKGGQFIDRFMPAEPIGELRSDVWGGDNVLPRDVMNGIEDQEYSYWGGNIIKGDDGKYHMYPCRWPENNQIKDRSGHMTWGSSKIVHAVSDTPMGPFKVVGEVGGGHNPEIYKMPDGRFTIGSLGYKAYRSNSLYGPWELVKTKIQWQQCPGNTSNRTYVMRDDGSSIVMNQNGKLYYDEFSNEDMIELQNHTAYVLDGKYDCEDPVFWRDEVQYNCVYNDPLGRVAFYMRSDDGVTWQWEEGVAYTPDVIQYTNKNSEKWDKLERSKIVVDEYGRATHMNFAVIDCAKWDDKANDIHSSKNVVMPLRVARRMEILNAERLTANTSDIRLRIMAEEGFDPIKDVDIESLKFGAADIVNFGGGAVAKSVKQDGRNIVVTFDGEGNGLKDHDFAAKVIGRESNGELLFGYAKMKRSPATIKDEIRFHTAPNEIRQDAKMRIAVYFTTKEPRLLCADLVDVSTGKKVAPTVSREVDGKDLKVLHYAPELPLMLDLTHKYRFDIYLADVNAPNKRMGEVKSEAVTAISLDAKDELAWVDKMRSEFSLSNPNKLQYKYSTKSRRDINILLVNGENWTRIRTIKVAEVEGEGTIDIDMKFLESDGFVAGDYTVMVSYLSRPNEGVNGRVSNEVVCKGPVSK